MYGQGACFSEVLKNQFIFFLLRWLAVLKKFLSKVKKEVKKRKPRSVSLRRRSSRSLDKEEFENRFQKFYHLNKRRLNKERRGNYKRKAKSGICVRCSKKIVPGIVFCSYHQAKQKEYNAKARKRRKLAAKKKS